MADVLYLSQGKPVHECIILPTCCPSRRIDACLQFQLAVTHHVGNYVATTRGPNPNKEFESMPIYVRVSATREGERAL